jgi:hypothetical protein
MVARPDANVHTLTLWTALRGVAAPGMDSAAPAFYFPLSVSQELP